MAWLIPVRPAGTNCTTAAMQKSIGVWKRIRPPTIVAVQFSTFTPVGIAISILDAIAKNKSAARPSPPRTCDAPKPRG